MIFCDRWLAAGRRSACVPRVAAVLLAVLWPAIAIAQQPASRPATQPLEVLKFPEQNFTLVRFPEPWRQVAEGKLVPPTVTRWVLPGRRFEFLVTADMVGSDTPAAADDFADRVIAELRARFDGCEILGKSPQEVNGLKGVHVRVRMKLNGNDIVAVYWMYPHHGVWYKLVTAGPASDEAAVYKVADAANVRFNILDPDRLIRALQPVKAPTTGPASSTPLADDRLTFDEFNFTFDVPPAPYRAVRKKDMSGNDLFGYSRLNPDFGIYASAQTASVERKVRTLTEMVDLWMKYAAEGYDSARIIDARDQDLQGVTGRRITVRTVINKNGKAQTHVYWIGQRNGFFYVLHGLGYSSEEQQVVKLFDEMTPRFRLINPDRQVHDKDRIAQYRSEKFPYTVKFKTPNWASGRVEKTRNWELGDFSAECPDGFFRVCAMSLMGDDPGLDELAEAFLNRVDASNVVVQNKKPIREGELSGYVMDFDRQLDKSQWSCRVKVLKGNDYAYFVYAMHAGKASDAVLTEWVEAFIPEPAAARPAVTVQSLEARERLWHAHVFTAVAAQYNRHQQFDKAILWGEKAAKVIDSPDLMADLAFLYADARRSQDAHAQIRKAADAAPLRLDLLARAAGLEARLGHKKQAVTYLSRVFFPLSAHIDDEAFALYVGLLRETGDSKSVEETIKTYKKRSDTARVALAEADFLIASGRADAGLAILNDWLTNKRYEVSIGSFLVDYYLQHEQFEDTLRVAKAARDKGEKGPALALYEGEAYFRLRRYRESKAAYEIAERAMPNDKRITRRISEAAAMLGQGRHSDVATEIPAVHFPVELLDTADQPPAPADSSENLVYLLRLNAVSFMPGDKFRATSVRRIKVLTQQGVEACSTLQFDFNETANELYVNKLQVIDPAGKVVSTGKVSDYYTMDQSSGEIASHAKVLNVPVAGLKPGDTIEVWVTKRDRYPSLTMPYFEHRFGAAVPVQRDVLYFTGDLRSIAADVSKNVTTKDLRAGRMWTIDSPPRFHREPLMQDVLEIAPHVALYDVEATWQKEGKSYLGLIGKTLRPDNAAADLAKSLTANTTNEQQIIAALARHVQSGYTYKAIEFGRRARVPDSPSEIISNRYGDCKDHALLLHHLLRECRVPSYLALVRASGPLIADAPSLDQFDHVIVCIPPHEEQKDDLWIDCTDKNCNIVGGVPSGLAGKTVLLLDAASPRLATIGGYSADSGKIQCKSIGRVDVSGRITVDQTATCHGQYAATFRSFLRGGDPRKYAQVMGQALVVGLGDAEVRSVRIDNLDQLDQPLVFHMQYIMHRRFNAAGDAQLIGLLPAVWERFYLEAERVDHREMPFRVPVPIAVESSFTLVPPSGYRVKDVPAGRTLNSEFGKGILACAQARDVLAVNFSYRVNVGTYPADKYAAFEASRREAIGAIEPQLVLVKDAGP